MHLYPADIEIDAPFTLNATVVRLPDHRGRILLKLIPLDPDEPIKVPVTTRRKAQVPMKAVDRELLAKRREKQ